MSKSELAFPGINYFTSEQAQMLVDLLQRISGNQQSLVISICEKQGIGWDSSGFPETTQIATVEQVAKVLGCTEIVLETAKVLGQTFDLADKDTILGLVETGNRIYENMPQLVYQHFQQQQNP